MDFANHKELSDKEIQEIFDNEIVRRVFGIVNKPSSNGIPTTVLIGAQPAAGKTMGQRNAISLYHDELIPIVGDDFRQFHPLYNDVMETNPVLMPNITKQMSARLVEKCIEYANQHGYSTIVEGTWRSDDVVIDTATEAKEYGRAVHLIALATKPAISRIGILARYYEDVSHGIQARWTPPIAHETVLKNIDSNITDFAQSKIFDNYKVLDRSGHVLYDGNDGQKWHDIWHDCFTSPLTPDEQQFVDDKSRRYNELAKKYTPEHAKEVSSILSAARSGTIEPLIYVEPYMRKGTLVSGYYRHTPHKS